MPILSTTYALDQLAQTATLIHYADGVAFTTYWWAPSQITMSERLATIFVSRIDFVRTQGEIHEWVTLLQRFMQPPGGARADSKIVVQTHPNNIQVDCTLGGTKMLDAKFRDSTQEIEFQPRAQLVVSFDTFRRFDLAMTMLRQEIG